MAEHGSFEIVGRYALHGEIASGGMATVNFGRLVGPVGSSRPVAVKRLHPGLARDPQARAMFLDEGRLVSCIRHPNVVPTLDVVAADGQLLIVMEYVHGETLARLARASRARQERIALPIVLSIAIDLLHGLHAAHEARGESGEPLGIVHRDVSPQNVIVGVDGVARVLDFGIATAAARLERASDAPLDGKLAYMAPEQIAGERLTRAADVYAAGVVLWELLSGRRLFVKSDGARAVLVGKLLRGPIEPPSAHDPSLPDALDAIVLRALARMPESRYSTAREMARALESLGERATATEVGDWVAQGASDALRARASALADLERPGSAMRPRSPSGIEVDVLLEEPLDDPPLSSDPPPMIAASATFPLGDARLPKRAASALPIVAPTAFKRTPWRAIGGVAFGVVVGVGGGQVIGTTFLRRDAPRVATAPPPPAVVTAAPPLACPAGMVAIPGGTFTMGDDDGAPFERPAHSVRLSPFCIDRLEATTESYVACSDSGGCKRAATSNEWAGVTDRDHKLFDPLCNARDPLARAKHPINCVDWEMASQACRARGVRLPTEAEWELAARGTDARRYPWGASEPSAALLNACDRDCAAWGKKSGADFAAMLSGSDGFATTSPVGSFPAGASPYGVEDVAGNVGEWVADRYGDYTKEERTNPIGPAVGDARVVRGGAWSGSLAAWARPAFRTKEPPGKKSFSVGFRCATTP